MSRTDRDRRLLAEVVNAHHADPEVVLDDCVDLARYLHRDGAR